MDFKRGTFRVHGDVLEVYPAAAEGEAVRIEFFGDEVDRITSFDPLTGEIKARLEHTAIFPASHYVVSKEKMDAAILNIEAELEDRIKYFKSEDKLLEAQRISTEVLYKKDLHDPDNHDGVITGCDHSPRARHPGM